MSKYVHGTPSTRTFDRFAYHLEDIECQYCANFPERGGAGRSCGRSKCEFQDLRDACIAAGRMKRKRGWNNCAAH